MRILLAVSGGPDSMYMADKYRCNPMGDSIAVAHCNFHLRGEESDGDEDLVRSWCSRYGIECHVMDFDTMEYAKKNSLSIEMAARELRYNWFASLAREKGFDAVAVAHNADDNAETLVLNLLRGAGARGLSGMRQKGCIAGHEDVVLLRPLLGTSRKEIEEYLKANGVPFRIDSTNASLDYRRNRIRHEVMPVFSSINPSYLTTLSRDMDAVKQVWDIAEDYISSVKDKVLQNPVSDGELLRISIPSLMADSHWKFILFRLLEPYGFSYGDLEAIYHLLETSSTVSGKTFSSSAYRAVTTSDAVVITSLPEEVQSDQTVLVTGEGEYSLLGVKFTVSLEDWSSDRNPKQPEGVLIADAQKLPFPFVVRKWRSGDYMSPLGLKGKRKKVSDIFTDLKVSVLQKEKALVAVRPEEEKSAALLGLRIDESVKVTSSTLCIVKISL